MTVVLWAISPLNCNMTLYNFQAGKKCIFFSKKYSQLIWHRSGQQTIFVFFDFKLAFDYLLASLMDGTGDQIRSQEDH